MNQKQVTRIIDNLEPHYLDFCPSCGEEVRGRVIEEKKLRKILRKCVLSMHPEEVKEK